MRITQLSRRVWTSEFYSPFKHFADTAVQYCNSPVTHIIDRRETELFHLKQGVEGGALEDIENGCAKKACATFVRLLLHLSISVRQGLSARFGCV